MSAFTDRIHREWVARNRGGMGAVAPMGTHKPLLRSPGRGQSPAPAKVLAARPDKQDALSTLFLAGSENSSVKSTG